MGESRQRCSLSQQSRKGNSYLFVAARDRAFGARNQGRCCMFWQSHGEADSAWPDAEGELTTVS